MDTKKAQELLAKHQLGTLTPDEQTMLDSWYLDMAKNNADVQVRELAQKQAKVYSRLPDAHKKIRSLWIRIASAAAILIFLSTGGYFLLHRQKGQQTNQFSSNFGGDIKPGRNQATLTLSNGQKIVLTKGLSGQIAVQNTTRISASPNGITYQPAPSVNQFSYNTLSTARGEQSPYPLLLADGTKVWLNAESSITFPTAFNGKDRIVKLTGEAYFEVKHNPSQPFRVQTATQTIEDIGTAFNVNAYPDENATRTTLISGSVKINNLTLKPGEQTDGDQIRTVDVETCTAWKDGKFRFDGSDISTVMRQLSRWYDIEVRYQGDLTKEVFYGKLSRYKNISQVLNSLAFSKDVHFKIEGRRVTVSR